MSDRLGTNLPAPGLLVVPVFSEFGETRSTSVPSNFPLALSSKRRRYVGYESVDFNRAFGLEASSYSQSPTLYYVVDSVCSSRSERLARLGPHGPGSRVGDFAATPLHDGPGNICPKVHGTVSVKN